MKIGDRVRVRQGDMIGYIGRVERVLVDGDPPRARVTFDYRPHKPWEEWIPLDNLSRASDGTVSS